MKKRSIIFLCLIWFFNTSFFPRNKESAPSLKTQAEEFVKSQSVQFLENQGQMTDMAGNPVPFVLFKIDAPGLDLFITEQGLTYVFKTREKESSLSGVYTEHSREEQPVLSEVEGGGEAENKTVSWERIDMTLKGANIKKENIIKEDPIQGHFNYFYSHCPNGIYGVKEYGKITIKDIYPGIDWVLYNTSPQPLSEGEGQGSSGDIAGRTSSPSERAGVRLGGGFKYDFIVHPGADHKQIQLVYSSKEKLQLSSTGQLEAATAYGNLSEQAPRTFYEDKLIASSFKHLSTTENKYGGYDVSIGFDIPNFVFSPFGGDREGAYLIIDPQLVWATFYGGNSIDGPMSMDTDNEGNVFITGYTASGDFPVKDAGTFFQGTNGEFFILKFDNNGVRLWSTYYGSGKSYSIATDNDGNVFVTGQTNSINFPLQDAGTFFQGTPGGAGADAFILKFDNLGNRLWATLYGGNIGSGDSFLGEAGLSITTDNDGNVFVAGVTDATNFPLQDAGTFFQGTYGGGDDDAFILKFDNSGNRLWATYYGGSSNITSNFSFLGEFGRSITTDNDGNVFVAGMTTSANFPVQDAGTFFQGTYGGGKDDAFILKFDNLGNRLWATLYGGNNYDQGNSIVTDNNGNVFVTGNTFSKNFPLQDAGTFFQGTFGGVDGAAFILKFDSLGNRHWATYYGGLTLGDESDNLAIDACGNVYMSFQTLSASMATQASCDTGGYYDSTFNGGGDNFLTQFSNTGVLLWASYLGGNGDDFRSLTAVDVMDNFFVSGEWNTENPGFNITYPLVEPGGGSYFDKTQNESDDGFIVKFIASSPSDITNSVVVVNDSCCKGSATVNIIGGCELYNYFWSNDKQTINTTSLTDSISNLCAGSYWVRVESIESACSNFNNADTIYFTVVPLQECDVIVPNIFTPNGDGTNDYFVLKDIEKYPENKLIIYNRWGEKIQEFIGYKNTWTADGVSDGVYYYVLYLSDDEEPQTGFVTIVR